MIYLISVSSKLINEYSDYNKILNEINDQLTLKDRVIIMTSSSKNSSENSLEQILKFNIETSKMVIDSLLSLNEFESSLYLSSLLQHNNTKNIVLFPHQIPLIYNESLEYVEVNNLLQTLSKYQVVIIPGNVAVDKKLRFVSYGIDNSELLTCFIFKELKKRHFKIRCHIYKNIDKISKVDVNDYITDQFIDLIYSKDISNFNTSLSKVINQDTIDLIINNNLTLTIGNSFLKGTKII